MDVGSFVSRRTRSQLDAYYRKLHDSIKNRDRQHSVDDGSKIKNNQEPDTADSIKNRDRQHSVDYGSKIKNNQEADTAEIENVVDDISDVISVHDSESDDDDDDDEKKKKKCKNVAKKKVGRPAKKRARAASGNNIDFVSLLEKSDWRDKDDFERENPNILVVVDNDMRESVLPLKFKFEDDEQPSPSLLKSEWEMELDRLFNDLELGLWETDSCVLSDDECSIETDVNSSRAAMCSRGEHDEVLDEQIGIVCTYCHAILLEIKHVFPSFCVESPPEKGVWKKSSEEFKNPHEIHFKSSNSCNLDCSIPSKGTVFDLIPPSKKELYPHQLEGFELMWRNIAGDIHINNLQNLPSTGGRGCIISHAPGTGKTRLTIVFLQTLLRLYPHCRPVIIAPRGMLLTWEHELKTWKAGIPFHNLNESKLSDHEEHDLLRDQTVALGQHNTSTDSIRSIKILSWLRGGSILGVGYRLFEELAVNNKKTRCNDKFKKILLESPSLLILDEGHTPRNDQSLMWKVLTKVTTQRRIILSGTPFQNNFDELFNTLSLVNPRFSQEMISLGGSQVGRKRGGRRKNDAAREEWANLTRNEQGIKKLRAMIQPFVHIHKGSILQNTLPGMKDCLVILKPTDLQQKLLEQNIARVDNFLEQAHLASLISVHPSLVTEEVAFKNHKPKLKSLVSDPKAGVKTHFLINLIQISSRIHEKVLIFSEFIKPLLHIKKLLKSHFGYNEGREVMYIDGDLSMKQRQSLITSFNDKNGEAKVLLASQKACCEGISLVGASRVVLLDVSWNPSVERQAICRAYRLGQEKMVYVYHLITMMEVKKYARQTEKDRISELVFSDVGERERDLCREDVCEDKVLEAMVDHQGVGSMFERIVHQPKESDLVKNFCFVDLDF